MSSPKYTARGEAHRVRLALEAHDRLDTERFAALSTTLEAIHVDVKSLLESRTYGRGAWRAIVAISTVISVAVGAIFAWLGLK